MHLAQLTSTSTSPTGDSKSGKSRRRGGVRVVGSTATPTANGEELVANGELRVPLLLDMQLQGSLLPTVNQGPMAYAHAFLAADKAHLHPREKIQRLKQLFL